MAKKKVVKGGLVQQNSGAVMFNLGLTLPGPVAYSSIKVDLGMTLPILPGESEETAMERVKDKALEALNAQGADAVKQSSDFLGRKMSAAKTPGR